MYTSPILISFLRIAKLLPEVILRDPGRHSIPHGRSDVLDTREVEQGREVLNRRVGRILAAQPHTDFPVPPLPIMALVIGAQELFPAILVELATASAH